MQCFSLFAKLYLAINHGISRSSKGVSPMRTQHQSRRELDKIDRNILRILQEEGRISFTELGDRVGLSTTPCTERVRRLERDGVILGYTLRLRPDAAPDEIHAWTGIAVEGNQQGVVRALLGEPGVAALHDTNGRWDLLAELRVGSLAELSAALERVRRIKGVSATETSIHLHSFRG